MIDRRRFLELTALGAGAAAAGCTATPGPAATADTGSDLPPAIKALTPMTNGVVPIGDDERRQRIAKAQRLMTDARLDAIFMEGTTSCFYFTGMRWGQSERPFGVVLPREGELAYLCPAFENDRAHELLNTKLGSEVRTWEEDDSPYAVVAGIVRDRGQKFHRVGMEERVRFFIADGIRRVMPGTEITDAVAVTAGCRMIKTKAEIALLQHANDVTIAAYRAALTTLREGMPQAELATNITNGFKALGYSGAISVQFGKWTALPHGSATPQTLKTGDVVMIDDGATCEGYAADITRTVVFGTPTPRQREVWNLEKRAQAAAFAAVRAGALCESVDAAARKVLTDAGFGPGYKVPGLPHRTGHGIGLDGHEWTNFVKGNKTPIAVGMCFSDEPTIAIPGEFGIRLEDCLYVGEDGPHFFSTPSESLDKPLG